MATGLPTTMKWEIEFVAGTWTDVTADVDDDPGIVFSSRGRTSTWGTTQPSTVTITLTNSIGKYMPGASVLFDGTTAHPYYPNIVPRKRIRFSYVWSATTYIRGVWYITAWQPQMEGQVRPVVVVSAIDRTDILSRTTMAAEIETAYVNAGVNRAYWWPLNDQAPATQTTGTTTVTASARGSGSNVLSQVQVGTGGGFITTGVAGPMGGNGATCFTIQQSTQFNGQSLAFSGAAAQGRYGAVCQIQCGSTGGIATPVFRQDFMANDGVWAVGVDTSGYVTVEAATGGGTTTSTTQIQVSVVDMQWHTVGVFYESAGGGLWKITLDVDGVSASSITESVAGNFPASGTFRVGQGSPTMTGTTGKGSYSGQIANVAITGLTHSFTTMTDLTSATNGYDGEISGARIKRYLTAAGITAAGDLHLDPGYAVMSPYPQAGKSVLQACQDVCTTEAGGAVFYIAPDGRCRFRDRHERHGHSVFMVLDAVADMIGADWTPTLDSSNLINQSTVTRAQTPTLDASTQTASDATSITAYGLSDDGGFTAYVDTDAEALRIAQQRVAQLKTPMMRVSKVRLDLMTAENQQYTWLQQLEIGMRIRVSNLSTSWWPSTQLDLIVEGWTESPSTEGYLVQFDTSPADSPPVGTFDDNYYGRWSPALGVMTLNASITSAASSLAVATASGPKWTTTPTAYTAGTGLFIQIDQEVIKLSAAPGGSTSPQTFTVARGQAGTRATAHTAGAAVLMWPGTSWAL